MLVETGELAQRTWDDYLASAKLVVKFFGRDISVADLGPDDFAPFRPNLSKTRNVGTLSNEIGRIRAIFNWVGPKNLCIVDRPVTFGPMFKKPSAKVMRMHRAQQPPA